MAQDLRWDSTSLDVTYSFGRPFVDKPSFDGLPVETYDAARESLFEANRAAADWERLEVLFERQWFGPCACFVPSWDVDGSDDQASSDVDVANTVRPTAGTGTGTGAGAGASFFRLFRCPQPKPKPTETPQVARPVPDATASQTPAVYGAAAAPVPEPAFVASVAPESSPQKAVPVPKRMAGSAKGVDDGGHLPPAVPVEPSAVPAKLPEPVSALPTPPSRLPADDPTTAPLGPQLGTWADRQYRLLDPVPERGEFGPGSNSGTSFPSSAGGNNRSPNTPIGNGGTGSGGGSGSGGCEGSSANIAAQVPPLSITLQDLLIRQQQQQQHQQHYYPGSREANGHSMHNGQDGRQQVNGANGYTHTTWLNGGQQQQQHQQQQHEKRDGGEAPAQPVDMEAMMQEAAWRWRFTRRWQAEQARAGPDQASSAPRDQMDEALAYLQATNATTTVSMQIATTSSRGGGSHGSGSRAGLSMEGSLVLAGTMGTLGAAPSTLGGDLLLGACGSGSGSFTSGPRILGRQPSGELLAASREVASMNRRAALVLQQQLDCEQQADRRVQESLGQGPPWVGHFIPIVQIDEWGSFRFLMLKLREQSARGVTGSERQRILIRGHNYGSEGQLMEECNREILSLSHKHGLPFEAPTCMGGGVMEWRRDRDRHLHLHSGFVMDRALPLAAGGGIGPANGARPASAMDLLNLAAALARQSFPPTYKITVLT